MAVLPEWSLPAAVAMTPARSPPYIALDVGINFSDSRIGTPSSPRGPRGDGLIAGVWRSAAHLHTLSGADKRRSRQMTFDTAPRRPSADGCRLTSYLIRLVNQKADLAGYLPAAAIEQNPLNCCSARSCPFAGPLHVEGKLTCAFDDPALHIC